MFDISWAETAIVMLVALIFIGPKELPAVVRGVKKAVAGVKNMAGEFTSALNDLAEETDLKSEAKRINDEVKQIVDLEGNLQDTYDISDLMDEIENDHDDEEEYEEKKKAASSSEHKAVEP